jgi:1,4-dihydroxy-2-naphthoate octaprenyltransferase
MNPSSSRLLAGSQIQAGEPLPENFVSPAARLFFATRPAFLSVTLVGVLLGLACAYHDLGRIDPWTALMTLFAALAVHAGVNVVNDYHDSINGTDDANTDRIFPFTGGSRFIQNGVLSRNGTAALGYGLLAGVIPAGLLLMHFSGPGLLWIGLVGLIIGWAYSAPPLALNSRGLGELSAAVGFGCVVVGADYVQRHAWDSTPFAAGSSYALFVTNLLFINQFPDRAADLAVGKLHWVARLPPMHARWGYVLIAGAGGSVSVSGVARECLPPGALLALLALIPAAYAARGLFRYCETPRLLGNAIRATILATVVNGLVVAGALVMGP